MAVVFSGAHLLVASIFVTRGVVEFAFGRAARGGGRGLWLAGVFGILAVLTVDVTVGAGIASTQDAGVVAVAVAGRDGRFVGLAGRRRAAGGRLIIVPWA